MHMGLDESRRDVKFNVPFLLSTIQLVKTSQANNRQGIAKLKHGASIIGT